MPESSMVPTNPAPALYPLRSVTQRLTSTPTAQLPQITPSLARTLSTCGDVLATVEGQGQHKNQPDTAILLHKLKTQITTLLQDRSKEARWSAVVLVKATVEAGGWSILQGSGKWIRLLLGVIGRPEPLTTKKLSIVILTRIFLLTQEHQSLVRELTTPSLPSFFTACLRLVEDSKDGARRSAANDSFLSTILWAFGKILPHHPTACRPFVTQMRALVLPLIAPTPSSLSVDETPVKRRGVICSEITAHRARHVFALLSGCAAKNNQGHEWSQCLSTIIERTHQTADHVFRALLEDWEHLSLVRDRRTNDSALIDHELELPGWRGTYAGLERLNGLLLTVQVHLTLPTASTADTPIGKLVDLIDRMLSALPPPDDYSFGESRGTRTNPEIGRDEPEMLWLWLPQIHLTTLQILEQLIVRLGEDAMALHHRLLSHVLWTFEHEHSHVGIREVVYRVVASMLAYCGPGLPPAIASSLVHCLNRSCKELVTIQEGLNDNDGDKTISKPIPSKGSTNADTYVPGTSFSSVTTQAPSEAQRMAEKMLCAALAYLPTGILSYSVRRKIDQTAILAQSKPLLQASVLCPPSRRRGMQHASLMPFLARQFPQDQGTEALLRPRMPPVQQGIADPSNGFDEGADDQEEIPETTRYSPSSIDDAQNDTVPTNMELDTEKQTTLSSRTSKMASPSAEVQPDASLQPLQPVFEPTVPAKRSLELAFEGTDVTSANEPGNPLAPGAESASKRIREGVIHIPPAIEEDFPPSQLNDPSDAFGPKAIEMSAQTEPLTNPHTVHDTMNDDDSDDSSIPVLDPTWATDEDEEDEEEQE